MDALFCLKAVAAFKPEKIGIAAYEIAAMSRIRWVRNRRFGEVY
jgi:hypothetical protein